MSREALIPRFFVLVPSLRIGLGDHVTLPQATWYVVVIFFLSSSLLTQPWTSCVYGHSKLWVTDIHYYYYFIIHAEPIHLDIIRILSFSVPVICCHSLLPPVSHYTYIIYYRWGHWDARVWVVILCLCWNLFLVVCILLKCHLWLDSCYKTL